MKRWYQITTKAMDALKPPLVELMGDHRVLIENHLGIAEYGGCRITVKTHSGCISVMGDCLQIAVITKERVVITGKISGMELHRGG